MPRSLWNGTVSVGLIAVPVKLYSATESGTVRFREVHLADEAKVEHRRFCSEEEKEVPYEEVVRGFEVGKGEYVVLEKDELAAAAGDRAHTIDVEVFVPDGAIDPVHYAKAYTSGRGSRAPMRTGCCATRWSDADGSDWAGSRSTTGSTWRRSVRATECWRCTRCASPTSSSRAPASGSRSRAAVPSAARSRWPASSWSRSTRRSTPAGARTSTARRCST